MRNIHITQKQRETLDFIRTFISKNRFAPTITELADGLSLQSLRSVTQRLEALESKGFIRRDRFKHRGIVLLESTDSFSISSGVERIPVIASAGCDALQVYAQQKYDEFIVVDKNFLNQKKEIVAIKAVGNSMVDAGIHNGDYVLVEITSDVENGDRIVAIIGDMAVIKRLRRTENETILEPEAKGAGYSPIILNDGLSRIFGKVLRVIKTKVEDDFQYILEES